jgi:hypothetical protein
VIVVVGGFRARASRRDRRARSRGWVGAASLSGQGSWHAVRAHASRERDQLEVAALGRSALGPAAVSELAAVLLGRSERGRLGVDVVGDHEPAVRAGVGEVRYAVCAEASGVFERRIAASVRAGWPARGPAGGYHGGGADHRRERTERAANVPRRPAPGHACVVGGFAIHWPAAVVCAGR